MLESSPATQHLDRIKDALGKADAANWDRHGAGAGIHGEVLLATESLTALRASIAEMERERRTCGSLIKHNHQLAAEVLQREAQIAALTVERDQARAALEAAEEIGSGVLSVASDIGSYDGEDPGSALSCIRGELAEYSRAMWAIAGTLNSGSARPDDVEAAVLWAAQRIVALEEALRALVNAIGCCTCQPFWDQYGKRDPNCAFHDCEAEIVAGRAALSSTTKEPQ